MILEGQKLQKIFEVGGPAAGAEVCGNQKSADFGVEVSHAWHPAKGRGGGFKGFAPAAGPKPGSIGTDRDL